ncbi:MULTISPECIES: WD40 repeat domain-containing protein [Nostoc]|uniref:WD40 repeat domain-containing protein n=1 Tax=Nostoc paludosum FACHB-159 TaxID=2692908 RepID=A0ABR8KKQ4_9NOSO|nr:MULTISPECIES: WD40 repeat domain-containing protein [Nostoc]MBD2682930.1 WD40 repeat domain-containing protein [Nostoc sp. FACHB-857]MBD2739269.1 WD40 repeat domain-containing protein [Nostoc paludosum FACHB-159]
MKLPILFKTLSLLSFFLVPPFSMMASIPVIANTLNTLANTEQPKRLKLTLSGHTEPVRALNLSPSGQVLASGSDDKTIKLWNPTTGALLRTLTGHRERIKSIVITPDDQTLISTSFDNTIKFWNTQTGKEIRTIAEKTGVRAMLLTPDGQTLISGSGDQTIKFRNLKTRKIHRILKVEATALAISRDGKTLFSGGENGGKIRVWSLVTGKQLRSFTPPLPKKEDLINGSERASAPITLAVSNDGKMLLCGGYDDSFQSGGLRSTDGKSFKAWDLKTAKLVHNFSLGTSIDALIISPDSKTFITGGLGREIILRDIKTGKPVMELTGHAGGIYGLALSSDGKTLYSGSGDKSVKVWQLES